MTDPNTSSPIVTPKSSAPVPESKHDLNTQKLADALVKIEKLTALVRTLADERGRAELRLLQMGIGLNNLTDVNQTLKEIDV